MRSSKQITRLGKPLPSPVCKSLQRSAKASSYSGAQELAAGF